MDSLQEHYTRCDVRKLSSFFPAKFKPAEFQAVTEIVRKKHRVCHPMSLHHIP